MANERVSQLIELLATDLQTEDLFLITDMSQKESKRLTMDQLLLFIESSGSFFASDSTHAHTASYILANNIDGVVSIALLSSQSISSSISDKSISSSYAFSASTSSYASFCAISEVDANSASYLVYIGAPNGTASYALTTSLANIAVTSLNLFYNGQPNGTASYAMSSSATISSSYAISSSFAQKSYSSENSLVATSATYSIFSNSSSYFIGNYNPIKAWAFVTWSSGVAFPGIISNYNISSIKWLNTRFATIGGVYYGSFGVSFSSPLPALNYTMIGNGYFPYSSQGVFPFGVFLHPIFSNRTSTNFTMSITTPTAQDLYTAVSASYPYDERLFISFQILGI